MFAEKLDECSDCGHAYESQEDYDFQRCTWCKTKQEIGEAFAKDLEKIMSNQRDHVMQFFDYDHLPEHLQAISKPFGEMALSMESNLPRNPQRTMALNKLLEAKDHAVRAVLAK